ncbi:hypothetical protein [Actinomadura kijaniata]|uniref:hypothetical protein n=1 Tax=Actinomadura kijaniata TaxID=46161 RepID=UPI000830B23A|nr:hypothetical protein [Actinomadura kijaniata]
MAHDAGGPRRRLVLDRGEGAPSYLAVVLLIAGVVAAVSLSSVPAQLVDGIKDAVCQVIGAGDCRDGGRGAPATAAPTPSARASEPGKRDRGDEKKDEKKDDGNCWDWADWACATVDGLRLGTGDVLTDVWDGATFTGCLVHICSHEGFKSNWGSLKDLVTTNPVDTGKRIWDESTKKIRDDWNNGHKVRAVARAVPTVLGTIFGGKGLTKIRRPKGDKPPEDKKPEDKKPDEPPPGKLQEILGRIGEPSPAFVFGRGYEVPYVSPPGTQVVRHGAPLDVGGLDPSKTYLWIVDAKGDIRLAPETSPDYKDLYGKRPGHAMKHGDLAAGSEHEPVPEGMRPPARIGGELKAEIGPDGKPTGRWLMDNNSSYSRANTRMDGRRLGEPELRAAHDLLGATGTDTSKIVVTPR